MAKKHVVLIVALVLFVAGCHDIVSPERSGCMIDDMEEIIACRQTVEFSLTTSRITGESRVTISGPGYCIDLTGVPGEWRKLLADAISDWYELTDPKEA